MVEPARLNIVLLLVAIANLATDITRLSLEWTPSDSHHDGLKRQMNGGQPDAYGQGPDAPVSGNARKDLAPRRMKPDPRESWPAPFSRLRPDFSYRRPPWCVAGCRQPMRPFERRDVYEWRHL